VALHKFGQYVSVVVVEEGLHKVVLQVEVEVE
jgi:hypothetical protein